MALAAQENKYRWHDLKKDPKDLPEDDNPSDFFWCCIDGGGYRHGYEVIAYDFAGGWLGPAESPAEVIAWREIELFKEGQDES